MNPKRANATPAELKDENERRTRAKRVRIGKGRLSFPHVFEPQETEYGLRYSVTLLLPPDTDLQPIRDALLAAAEEEWGPDPKKWPARMRGPDDVIRPCSEKSLAGYEPGWHFVAAASKQQPGVVDGLRQTVTDPVAVYAGRWANISCNAFAYSNKSTGVSLGLNNVQLLQHDDAFGRTSARQDFDDVVDELEAGEAAPY